MRSLLDRNSALAPAAPFSAKTEDGKQLRTALTQSATTFVNLFDANCGAFGDAPNAQELIRRDDVRRLARQVAGLMDSLASLLPVSAAKLSPVTDLHGVLGRVPALALGGFADDGFMALSHFRASRHWLRCAEAELLAAMLAVVRVQLESSAPTTMEILTEDGEGPGAEVRVSLIFDGITHPVGEGPADSEGLRFMRGLVFALGGQYRFSISERQAHHEFLLPAALR